MTRAFPSAAVVGFKRTASSEGAELRDSVHKTAWYRPHLAAAYGVATSGAILAAARRAPKLSGSSFSSRHAEAFGSYRQGWTVRRSENCDVTRAYVCDAVRTPFGRFAGALSPVRTDDLAAVAIAALVARNANVDWDAVDDVIFGCANQAGEDNRNVARMASLLAGLSTGVSGTTINRLCGSGMDAVAMAARAIKTGEAELAIAGGVESMSRAPFVVGKPDVAFARSLDLHDTTIGWRFINQKMRAAYGVDSMPETAENVAAEFAIARADQDAFALRSQQRAADALARGAFEREIVPVTVSAKRGPPITVTADEHPRPDVTLEALAKLPGVVRPDGTVTAGNASGINDGACAVLIASEAAVERYALTPLTHVVGAATAGVPPRIMGMGPVPATRKVMAQTRLSVAGFDVIELNEAFAAQALAVLRELAVPDDAAHVNANGGAIALGHPLGASGARLVTTASYELARRGGRFGLCTMCIGVGQGIALVLERAP
jgi:acetyl-CoA acyltransferase